jgi:ribosomal protein L16 Arg81 hydroxylase
MSADEFLSKYWRQQYLYCRGSKERFDGLLSWRALNELLEHHWRETHRFRLALQGRDLDPASYADCAGPTPRIRAKDVTNHLRRGATLSFDAIDELHWPVRHLAESFEALFRGSTKINAYAAWRALHGLDLHRDNEEIFILQLNGTKRWLLYGSSIDGVDRTELKNRSVPPAGALLDQILRPGDLLYVPRGCYHVALPMNEPVLHLTLGVRNPRGMNILQWMVDRFRASAIADRDLPGLAAPAERLQYSEELRSTLLEGLAPDLVEQYFSETDSNFTSRPSFNLPWSATPDLLPPGREFLIRLTTHSSRLANSPDVRVIELRCAGRRYRFPSSMQWVIEQLGDGAQVPMGRLLDALEARLDEGTVRLLVAMLVKSDLAAISARPA